MSKTVFNNIEEYYNQLVKTHGHDPRSCDYGHAESQAIKFKTLHAGCNIEGKTILDIGCGFADYYKYLKTQSSNFHYVGIDISKAMIQTAQKVHPKLELIHGNFLEFSDQRSFDIVTANGIFYLLENNAENLMKRMIQKMFEISNEAVLFNTLSTAATDQVEGEFYADPLVIYDYCKSMSPWLTLRHDYHHRDFTIYLYKNRQQ